MLVVVFCVFTRNRTSTMDMARTSVNVVGNRLATVLLCRWEVSFTLTQDVVSTHLSPELRGAPT